MLTSCQGIHARSSSDRGSNYRESLTASMSTMPVKYRFLPVLALILISAVALSGCLPTDPVEGRRLAVAKKVIEDLPGVTGVYTSNSNGLDAGQQSSFAVAVSSTATPAQLEVIIIALSQALDGTTAGKKSISLSVQGEGGDRSESIPDESGVVVDNGSDIIVDLSADAALPELLDVREKALAVTDIPFDLIIDESPRFIFRMDGFDAESLELVAPALRETDAEVGVRIDSGMPGLRSYLSATGPDLAAALDLWALVFAAVSPDGSGVAIELSTKADPWFIEGGSWENPGAWRMQIGPPEASAELSDELIRLLKNWIEHNPSVGPLAVDVIRSSNGERAIVSYEMTSAGQTCSSSVPSLCH